MADNANETVKVKSNTVSDDKVLAAVATIPLVGLIIYYAMPDASDMVKHYAKQSNALLAINLITMVLGFTFILAILSLPLSLLAFVLWVLLLVKALQGEKYTLPVVGEYFDKLLK
ncbi:MAG TPA: hypothetical protein PK863_06000 [Candidatus Dojkabacteria bacterium]|nr:hypothetical protein [Candidatus Dojkabacteria bacterium]HRP51498.1 hypothetical protein [Candidatus Dojkabacteria bacterium]